MQYILPAAAVLLLILTLYIVWKVKWGSPPPAVPAVLAYHKVTRFETGGTWITPARFAGHIDKLLDSGRKFIDEGSFIDSIYGKRKGDRSEILLTFDDGYSMLLDNALPLLERRSIPALIFLVTSYAGLENCWELPLPGRKFRHMGWDEARDAAGRGFSFGSHTCTHRDLTGLDRGQIMEEIAGSRDAISARLGKAPRSLSYPFGRTDPRVAGIARESGYEAGFTMYPSGRNCRVDPFELRREGVWVIDTPLCLRAKLSGEGFFWVEDIKGRVINGFAGLTPLLKGLPPGSRKKSA